MRKRVYKKSVMNALRKEDRPVSRYKLADLLDLEHGDELLDRVIEKLEAEGLVERAMGQFDGMLGQMVFLKPPPPQMGRGRRNSMPSVDPSAESFDSRY